jgi:PAS domain S-box-containing protein
LLIAESMEGIDFNKEISLMQESVQSLNKFPHFKRTVFFLAAGWTAAVFLAFGWHMWDLYELTVESARLQASNSFEKDLVYRRWATRHGGVFVPVTEETPPNPYLIYIKNRDVTTTSGLDLTLINPAYMTRQVQEMGLAQYGHQGHITSLNPIRSENSPDSWEAAALESFELGKPEAVELAEIGGKQFLRLMRPMFIEDSCLKCHEAQGYKEGDIRGGISVSVPMGSLLSRMYTHMAGVAAGYAFIWLTSLGGIALAASYIGSSLHERELMTNALKKSEEEYRSLFRNMQDGFAVHEIILDDDGRPVDYRFLSVNPAFETLTGLATEKIVGKTALEVMPYLEPSWIEIYGKVALEGEAVRFENSLKDLGKTFEVCAYCSEPGKFACVFVDITDRIRAEAGKVKLEEQLRRAQKVESIGRLAGGVAHELNNQLTPILGYSEMLIDELEPDDVRRDSVDEILKAGFRTRDLVRQLLAFGRKQTFEYKAMNLNKLLTGLEKMLRRMVREDINIEIIQSPDLPEIMVDTGQIEQVVMNLSVNAQDAMPEGGRLTIETALVDLDEDFTASRHGVQPGAYVKLAVSDTGYGMNFETLGKIFEPFFTTKAELGTGLGLATVYGIVKQHDGDVTACSEPGKGSTFTVYLPVPAGGHEKVKTGDHTAAFSTGSETIMLVEDNEQVRNLARRILDKQGYKVLVAERGPEALKILEAYDDHVHLLLTDVVMPEMNGRDLLVKIAAKRPDIKVLYMSGYTENVIAQHGVMEEGIALIQKPFSIKTLAAKVREVLNR